MRLSKKIGNLPPSERKIVTKETHQGCLSFSITHFQDFYGSSENATERVKKILTRSRKERRPLGRRFFRLFAGERETIFVNTALFSGSFLQFPALDAIINLLYCPPRKRLWQTENERK